MLRSSSSSSSSNFVQQRVRVLVCMTSTRVLLRVSVRVSVRVRHVRHAACYNKECHREDLPSRKSRSASPARARGERAPPAREMPGCFSAP